VKIKTCAIIVKAYGGRIQTRSDGRIEWVCEHGVGHTIGHRSKKMEPHDWIHGCDGCCDKVKELTEAL
jgi:hypothetical protein